MHLAHVCKTAAAVHACLSPRQLPLCLVLAACSFPLNGWIIKFRTGISSCVMEWFDVNVGSESEINFGEEQCFLSGPLGGGGNFPP